MLKITSIVSSIIFLLFLATGSYARTHAKASQQQEASKVNEKEKSKDENEKPVESAVQLDVFKAISLVNSQLRWKDYHAEKAQNSRLLFSSKKLKTEAKQVYDHSEKLDGFSPSASLPNSNSEWVVVIWADEVNASNTVRRNLSVQESTIAFILNCGTYPHEQS
ncbi:MAG: hypothetical protein ACFHU9_17345 [Fluviicola sp.]